MVFEISPLLKISVGPCKPSLKWIMFFSVFDSSSVSVFNETCLTVLRSQPSHTVIQVWHSEERFGSGHSEGTTGVSHWEATGEAEQVEKEEEAMKKFLEHSKNKVNSTNAALFIFLDDDTEVKTSLLLPLSSSFLIVVWQQEVRFLSLALGGWGPGGSWERLLLQSSNSW